MSESFDFVVAGLGGIGSAILAECARRGAKAIGLDRHAQGHQLGSSSGESRLFRKAYFEDERYIPLLKRAEDLWRRLETETGCELLRVTGLLTAGVETSTVLQRASLAAARHGIALDALRPDEVRSRFPAVAIRDEEMAIFEAAAGVVEPEAAVAANLQLAERMEAKHRHDVSLVGWKARKEWIAVALSDASELRTRKLILALGPWFGEQMRSIGVPLRIQRNVQVWFSAMTEKYNFPGSPAFFVDRPDLPARLYGFPDFGHGLKVAFHGFGDDTKPETMMRAINQERDVRPLQSALEKWVPGAARQFIAGKACPYSLTPDQNFVIDFHPENPNVIFCGGFSGHGFKFAPVIGEIAVDLALHGRTEFEIEFLSARRFGSH